MSLIRRGDEQHTCEFLFCDFERSIFLLVADEKAMKIWEHTGLYVHVLSSKTNMIIHHRSPGPPFGARLNPFIVSERELGKIKHDCFMEWRQSLIIRFLQLQYNRAALGKNQRANQGESKESITILDSS